MNPVLSKIRREAVKAKIMFRILRLNAPFKIKLLLIEDTRQTTKKIEKAAKAINSGEFAAPSNKCFLEKLGMYYGVFRRPQESRTDYMERLRTAMDSQRP